MQDQSCVLASECRISQRMAELEAIVEVKGKVN
jgi:hypothetical protein